MNYVKATLYAYPQMETIGRCYGDHIANRAICSHNGRVATEKLMVCIAEEIEEKRMIERLKGILDKLIAALSAEERLLLDIRYFGKMEQAKRIFASIKAGIAQGEYAKIPLWSERTYFRRQTALLKKIALRLKSQGIDKETFLKEYAGLDGVGHIYRYLELRCEEESILKKEKQFLDFLAEIR